jgi:hypothetical protein
VSALVERALRELVAPSRRPEQGPFRMITFGARRKRVHREPADFARELEREDELMARGG